MSAIISIKINVAIIETICLGILESLNLFEKVLFFHNIRSTYRIIKTRNAKPEDNEVSISTIDSLLEKVRVIKIDKMNQEEYATICFLCTLLSAKDTKTATAIVIYKKITPPHMRFVKDVVIPAKEP